MTSRDLQVLQRCSSTRLLLFSMDLSVRSVFVRMWGVCFSRRLPGRAASRVCHSRPSSSSSSSSQHSNPEQPSSSSSQLDSQRPKAEKRRRRREREEAVLTRQRNVSNREAPLHPQPAVTCFSPSTAHLTNTDGVTQVQSFDYP